MNSAWFQSPRHILLSVFLRLHIIHLSSKVICPLEKHHQYAAMFFSFLKKILLRNVQNNLLLRTDVSFPQHSQPRPLQRTRRPLPRPITSTTGFIFLISYFSCPLSSSRERGVKKLQRQEEKIESFRPFSFGFHLFAALAHLHCEPRWEQCEYRFRGCLRPAAAPALDVYWQVMEMLHMRPSWGRAPDDSLSIQHSLKYLEAEPVGVYKRWMHAVFPF